MSDRYKGFVVTLAKDIHAEGSKEIINAIKMLKGVIDVTPVTENPYDDEIIRMRTLHTFQEDLVNLLEKHFRNED